MTFNIVFITNSILLGIGLAMDAFSVSLANGLQESKMPKSRACFIAGIFAFFQALMPMLGWFCVHLFISFFTSFSKFIPWIALILLLYIGGSMILEAFKKEDESSDVKKLCFAALLVQGVATSIDALSVGFTISEYNALFALLCAGIIALVTFIICLCGVAIGKKFGTRLSGKANVLGGAILVFIGIEIFIKGVFM